MSTESKLLLDAIDKRMLGEQFQRMYRRDRSIPAVFLLCTHEWGNIGDLAINYNEIAQLEAVFPDRLVFAISRSALAANWQRIQQTITPDDLVAVHGGGNMGDIWPHEEAARLAVVEAFPRNRIVSMPQSIHFDDTAAQARSFDVYRRHPRLLVAVRDDRSLQIATSLLDADSVVRTEDAATRQAYPYSFKARTHTVLFVERTDHEKRADSGIDTAREALERAGLAVDSTDTMVPRLPFSNAELAAKLVYEKIDDLHSSAVVITDRLHGALFALIAGRPVVVFENTYGKIRGALESLLPSLEHRILFANERGTNVVPEAVSEMAALSPTDLKPATLLADAHRAFDQRLARFALS